MITATSPDGTFEIVIYQNDQLVIAINQNGFCVARFTIHPERLGNDLIDLVLPPPPIKEEV